MDHSGRKVQASLRFSPFTRRYLGNNCCILIFRLMICLSSADKLAQLTR